MQVRDFPKLDPLQIKSIPWKGDYAAYDLAISKLGNDHEKFVAVNPDILLGNSVLDRIGDYPMTKKCIVWYYKNIWIAKLFTKGWTPKDGYLKSMLDDQIELDPKPIKLKWEVNAGLSKGLIKFKKDPRRNFVGNTLDVGYELVWYIDPTHNPIKDKVWAIKARPPGEALMIKDMGYITPDFPEHLDVIFISYTEPNADSNWQRVLDKAPWAKRVSGVKGIFEAHRAAAKLSDTDMFYVVDGDARLTDEWTFDYQPSIFDRDCSFVWASRNPINDLVYGYGGVKIFNRSELLDKKSWNSLDMFTALSSKIKVIETISCTTEFNVDEFSTWRSAFRESVKLYQSQQLERLEVWMTKGTDRPYGNYSVMGARAGYKYASDCNGDNDKLRRINDYDWLVKVFDEIRN